MRPRPVHWLRAHPLLSDALLAVAGGVSSVAGHWFGGGTTVDAAPPSVFGTILVLIATVPIALRRRAPIEVLALVSGAQFLAEILDIEGSNWIGVLIALYSMAAHTSGRRRVVALAVFAVTANALVVVGYFRHQLPLGGLISTLVSLTGVVILGDNLQRRRQHIIDLGERAERAERERDLLARQRVHDERSRIARELHDVVAHSVSLMVIQAAAARRSIASTPAQAEVTLTHLEATGRQAMNELRRVLGVLRTESSDADELGPQPSLARIHELVASDPTMPVKLTQQGCAVELAPSVELSMYRVVQEALTNVRKHAGKVDKVSVKVAYEAEQLVIQIRDDGRGASVAKNVAGQGLIGMHERMALCGGSVTAGPNIGGGWQVCARAPLVGSQP